MRFADCLLVRAGHEAERLALIEVHVGGVAERVHGHLDAGCDLVLACFPAAVEPAIAAVAGRVPAHPERLLPLRGAIGASWDSLTDNPQRDRFVARITALDAEGPTA